MAGFPKDEALMLNACMLQVSVGTEYFALSHKTFTKSFSHEPRNSD